MIGISITLLLGLIGVPGVAVADHYSPAIVEPVTIPLWGPTWTVASVSVSVSAGKGVTSTAVGEVWAAIDDWNHAIGAVIGAPFPFLVPSAPGTTAQLIVKVKAGGGMVQGQALAGIDVNGFFRSCKVNVSGRAFGLTNSGPAVRSIALQELGHCLGLLHADNSDDVMFGTLQNPPNTVISVCDLDAWAAVMEWLLTSAQPARPSVSSVSCP
jgi:hypothetical protein